MSPDTREDYTYIASDLNHAFDKATHLPGNILIRAFEEASFQPHYKLNAIIRGYVEYLRNNPVAPDTPNLNPKQWRVDIDKMTASILSFSMQVKMDCHAGRVNGDDETSQLAKALEYMTASANDIRAKRGLEPLPSATINDGCSSPEAPKSPRRGVSAENPAASCASIGNDDQVRPIPSSLVKQAAQLFDLLSEDTRWAKESIVYRCMDGAAWLCNPGANLLCSKADTRESCPRLTASARRTLTKKSFQCP